MTSLIFFYWQNNFGTDLEELLDMEILLRGNNVDHLVKVVPLISVQEF